MSIFEFIVIIIGIILLIIGAISGYQLFTNLFKNSNEVYYFANILTFFGLFIFGLLFGLILIWCTLAK